MYQLLLATILLVSAINVQADGVSVPSDNKTGTVYVELAMPMQWIKSFKPDANALPGDEQKLDSKNIGLEAGFQPLRGKIQNDDTFATRLLKNTIITVDISGGTTQGSVFKDYLYSIDNPVSVFDIDTKCYSYDTDGYSYWDGSCSRCSSNSGYCTSDDVYGRDAYIKYSNRSYSIGLMLPVTIAKRLELEGGAVVRMHNVVEGYQTDALTSHTQSTLAAKAKLAVNLSSSGNQSLVASGEKSLTGDVKYWKGNVGLRFRFGNKN